jgi:hypothetical protein
MFEPKDAHPLSPKTKSHLSSMAYMIVHAPQEPTSPSLRVSPGTGRSDADHDQMPEGKSE